MATVVVFGGGGFLGRRLVDRLTAEGMTVRVAVRHPDPARIELRSMGISSGSRSSLPMAVHVRGAENVTREAAAAGVARLEFLPNPPLTTGQVDLLKTDNVVSGALPDVQELGIQPKTVEEVIPTYIGPRAPGPSLIGLTDR